MVVKRLRINCISVINAGSSDFSLTILRIPTFLFVSINYSNDKYCLIVILCWNLGDNCLVLINIRYLSVVLFSCDDLGLCTIRL